MGIVVSVIITTRNEEKNIGNCLASIKSQNFPSDLIETIVVDNNSTDRTKEIAGRYVANIYNFGPERSAQRNLGVKNASGVYILYLDADMSLSDNLISECVQKCENEGCDALYIPEKIDGEGFWGKVRDFERSFYNATCIDCVRFVRRSKFIQIGGFDESLTGPEDWDFDRRIGKICKVSIISSPVYHYEGCFNLRKYLRKKTYYAQWFDKYTRKWGKKDIIVRKQLGFCYRYIWVFLENAKWKVFFRNPLFACAMYSLRMILGLNYLINNLPKCKFFKSFQWLIAYLLI